MQLWAWLSQLTSRVPEHIGIDVGNACVHVVRLTRVGDNSFRLVGKGAGGIEPFSGSSVEVNRLKALVQEVGGPMKAAAMSMEDPSLMIKRMSIAPMPERDLIEAIRWNFHDESPIPIEELSVGYTPIPLGAEGGQRLLMAYAVSRTAIERYLALGNALGCRIISLEPSVSVLGAALAANGIMQPSSYDALVIIGDRISYFVVTFNGVLVFARAFAGAHNDSLVGLIARNVGVEEASAREIVENWIGGNPLETDRFNLSDRQRQSLALALSTFFSQLVIEIQRAIDAFCLMYRREKVDRMFICGLGAHYPGVVEHMSKTLGIDAALFDPFAGIGQEKIAVKGEMMNSAFSVAVGLAAS